MGHFASILFVLLDEIVDQLRDGLALEFENVLEVSDTPYGQSRGILTDSMPGQVTDPCIEGLLLQPYLEVTGIVG
jgi:hypothetical protein